jgi:hypothetical protein
MSNYDASKLDSSSVQYPSAKKQFAVANGSPVSNMAN